MRRLLPLLLFPFLLPAQTLDKPPQDVDDALRGRIKQFYDLFVEAKYRQAEQLIAEESKDDFYVLSKPELKHYSIGNIEYSEHFTKAKVVIIGAMPALVPMAAAKIMDFPFASYWKVIDGTWYWYYNKESLRHTPFGEANPSTNTGPAPTTLPAVPSPDELVARIQSAIQIDHTRVEIVPGRPQSIKVTNTLPGPATLSVSCPLKPLESTGVKATFDRNELKANEAATLTFSVDSTAPTGLVPIHITVAQTNQVLYLAVVVTRE